MKAAIVTAAGHAPIYGEFDEPSAAPGQELIAMRASALSHFSKSRADVVIDYLWGESALTVIIAIAKAMDDATPVRFVHVRGASGDASIDLPGAALRSSALVLMGSGAKSVAMPVLLNAVKSVFEAAQPAALKIKTNVARLSEIESAWKADTGTPRLVITIPDSLSLAVTVSLRGLLRSLRSPNR